MSDGAVVFVVIAVCAFVYSLFDRWMDMVEKRAKSQYEANQEFRAAVDRIKELGERTGAI